MSGHRLITKTGKQSHEPKLVAEKTKARGMSLPFNMLPINHHHHWFTRQGEEQHPNSILMQPNRGESSGEGEIYNYPSESFTKLRTTLNHKLIFKFESKNWDNNERWSWELYKPTFRNQCNSKTKIHQSLLQFKKTRLN